MLTRVCSKSHKLGFSSMWTENFQIYKLDLEKAEEPEIKLLNLLDYRESKGIPEKKIYFCFTDYMKSFDSVDDSKLWNIIKEMGIPDHIICLLRNLYVGQEATVRIGHGTTDWFQIGKGVPQHSVLSPCLFNLYAEWKWKLISLVWLFATPWTIYSPWNSPGQNTGVGSLSLLQGIFPTQESSRGLLHCRKILYQLSYEGSLNTDRMKPKLDQDCREKYQ